ncbi:hypothetical protein ACLGEF_07625 [Helicobacter pylori]
MKKGPCLDGKLNRFERQRMSCVFENACKLIVCQKWGFFTRD